MSLDAVLAVCLPVLVILLVTSFVWLPQRRRRQRERAGMTFRPWLILRVAGWVIAVIALPLLLRTYVPAARGVPALVGYAEGEYRRECLSGFGRAEECVPAVGTRVLGVLRATDGCEPGKDVVVRWLQREVAEAAAEQH